MEETSSLKREMSALEAQIPSEESVRRQEAAIKEELGAAWRQKLAAFSDENENLNELVMFLQQVDPALCSLSSVYQLGSDLLYFRVD